MPIISHLQPDGTERFDWSRPDWGWGPWAMYRVSRTAAYRSATLRRELVIVEPQDPAFYLDWCARKPLGYLLCAAYWLGRGATRAQYAPLVWLYCYGVMTVPEDAGVNSLRDALYWLGKTFSLRPSTLRERRERV